MQIIETFYQLLANKLTVAEFEAWVYNTPELETEVSEDDYLALLTLNYKTPSAAYELQKLLAPYISQVEVERRMLLEILETVANGGAPDKVLTALIDTWHWYLNDHKFLNELACNYGLMADDDFGWDPENRWKNMSDGQKRSYLASFYPGAQILANELIKALNIGTIQLHQNPVNGEVTYTDSRSKDKEQEAPDKVLANPWWQFWK